jgi:hypothetical protein
MLGLGFVFQPRVTSAAAETPGRERRKAAAPRGRMVRVRRGSIMVLASNYGIYSILRASVHPLPASCLKAPIPYVSAIWVLACFSQAKVAELLVRSRKRKWLEPEAGGRLPSVVVGIMRVNLS